MRGLLMAGAAFAALTPATVLAQNSCAAPAELGPVIETEAIDLVWSATNVSFDLVTQGQDQLIAYYNATRNLVVAHRRTSTAQDFYGTVWNYRQLDTMLGFDNHNDVVVAISDDGHFHVMGNMHADRIVYYRTRYPGEVRSLERVETLVDPQLERRVTYPHFMRTDDGALFARFRIGGSGNGNEIFYAYSDETGEWSLVHGDGFSDGEGIRNAYFSRFTRGPDGRFHVAWVWRSQGGSTMNSLVSYARSADLVHWEDAAGNPLSLPIAYEQTPVAAPVRDEEGMVNGHQHVGFDAQGRPLVTYRRYDENRIAQAYLARFNGSEWEQYQITDLDRVTHSRNRRGNETPTSVQLRTSPVLDGDGMIRVDAILLNRPVSIFVDAETLEPVSQCARRANPGPLTQWADHDDPRLQFEWMETRGQPDDQDHTTMISWHAMPGNRDRAREDITQPSTLRVHVLRSTPDE